MKTTTTKRQKIEPIPTLTFFQWIAVFFGYTLECDSPILESLHHSMFLFLDLAVIMDPVRLYTGMRERKWPAVEKAAWWELLQRLAIPKIQSLFPAESPFADFNKWFTCHCSDTYCNDRRRFPHTLVRRPDPDYWMLSCSFCISYDQDIYEPEKQIFGYDSYNVQVQKRMKLRKNLKEATFFQVGDWPVANGVFRWGIISNFLQDGTRSTIPCGMHGIEYPGTTYTDRSDAIYMDFLGACIVLSRPSIPYQRWKGTPME